MTSKLKAKQPEAVPPGKTKGCIFGPSGSGKTWFTLSFPTPYYIDTEGGADLRHYQERLKAAGGAYMGPSEGALDFPTVLAEMQTLATESHPYKTLVFDSITKLYQTAISTESERLGDKDVFGASKKPAIAYMRRLVNWAMRLDMNVWFVAHEVAEWGVINGQRTETGKIADIWDKLIYEFDLALRIQKTGPSRSATVRKTRLLGFPDGETFPLETNGEDVGYAEFSKRYGKDFIEAPVHPIALATDEQVGEIIRLTAIVKTSEAEVEKILTRAGADSWAELNEEQAAATIKWLNSKINPKGK
jgi:RecA/RadA recombinase